VPTNVISITDGPDLPRDTDLFNAASGPRSTPASRYRGSAGAQTKIMKRKDTGGGVRSRSRSTASSPRSPQFASDLDDATRRQLDRGAW